MTTQQDRERGGRRRWRFGAIVGLVYLVIPAIDLVQDDQHSWWQRGVALLLLVAFGAVYVVAIPFYIGSAASVRAWVPASMLALTAGMFPVVGPDVSTLWIFIGVAAAALYTMRQALLVALVLAAGLLLIEQATGEEPAWYFAITLVAVTLWMSGFIDNIKVTRQLEVAREELATMAVAAERARIGRDLHDILGHSLTAITVKSALAGRLVDRDPEAAKGEIAEVERLAREALSDVRATASGMRDMSLAAELAIAGSVLRAAGVSASLPGAVDDVAPGGREVFGYVVREAVTNVVRHAQATRCTVTVTPTSVEIADNGRGRAGASRDAGNGLAGLAERMAGVGGRLVAGPAAGGGFAVRAEMAAPESRQ